MSQSTFKLDPAPVLFDVSTIAGGELPARIERVALEHIELAENPRREIAEEGIDRLAKMLCASGQLVPCIGRRPDPDRPTVILYDGQRRYLAAKASHGLAGSEYMQGLAEPVCSLIVLLLDHAPSCEEIRRLQAHCQRREELTLADQQQQFDDCWQARAGLREPDRIAAVCNDLGISPKRAHNLRRQLTRGCPEVRRSLRRSSRPVRSCWERSWSPNQVRHGQEDRYEEGIRLEGRHDLGGVGVAAACGDPGRPGGGQRGRKTVTSRSCSTRLPARSSAIPSLRQDGDIA